MSSFITGLIDRVSQGLNQRLQDQRAKRLQEEAFQTSLKQQRESMPLELEKRQMLFEQDQAQKKQALQQALDMKETEMRRIADIKRRLDEESATVPIQTSPGLREAIAAGDMKKLPALVQTQGDVDFLNLYRQTFRQMLSSDPDHAYKIQAAREKARTEGFQTRAKIKESMEGTETVVTDPATGKKTTVKTPTNGKAKDGKKNNAGEIRTIKNSLAAQVKAFREDPRFLNEVGQFDEQKLVGTPEQFEYAKLLEEYNKAAKLENELNSKRLNDISGGGSSAGGSSAFERFMEFNQKVRDELKPKDRTVVKKSQAKQ